MVGAERIRKVACVGAGTVGHSWATLFSAKGYEVLVYDASEEVLSGVLERVRSNLMVMARGGLIGQDEVERALARITIVGSIREAVEDADYAQESVFESYEVKKSVFREMDQHAPEDIVLASSSSGLLMTEIQKATTRPWRCVIAHPWNPPHLIPLVEIVPGRETSEETIRTTYEFMEALGKVPIVVRKEVPGYVGNRLAAALFREAIDLVLKGVVTVEDVDKAVRAGPGIRWALMGPFLTYHLGGGPGGLKRFLEHLTPAFESWWKDMASWTEMPREAHEVLPKGVEKMVKGRKYEDLVSWRDETLIKLLKLLYGGP